MNWFIQILQKEARGRRFRTNDRVRYFTDNRKGKGKNIVLTPQFMSGTVVDYDPTTRRYKVEDSDGVASDVHPRNLVPESIPRLSSPPLPPPQESFPPVV